MPVCSAAPSVSVWSTPAPIPTFAYEIKDTSCSAFFDD